MSILGGDLLSQVDVTLPTLEHIYTACHGLSSRYLDAVRVRALWGLLINVETERVRYAVFFDKNGQYITDMDHYCQLLPIAQRDFTNMAINQAWKRRYVVRGAEALDQPHTQSEAAYINQKRALEGQLQNLKRALDLVDITQTFEACKDSADTECVEKYLRETKKAKTAEFEDRKRAAEGQLKTLRASSLVTKAIDLKKLDDDYVVKFTAALTQTSRVALEVVGHLDRHIAKKKPASPAALRKTVYDFLKDDYRKWYRFENWKTMLRSYDLRMGILIFLTPLGLERTTWDEMRRALLFYSGQGFNMVLQILRR